MQAPLPSSSQTATSQTMIPIGYLPKIIVKKPDCLNAENVIDIYSVGDCISGSFADYIDYWVHNGYWIFNSLEDIQNLVKQEGLSFAGTRMFYYEAYQYEFDQDNQKWLAFFPTQSIPTDVQMPTHKSLAGYDIVTFNRRTNPACSPHSCDYVALPEHSPLSCNYVAAESGIVVNKHCLFHTFEEAKEALEMGVFEKAEPGLYRIFAVYTVD
ncbi:hypothetical protein [Candidatus Albibeggiatoa sp. nov. NOAA]|uniref:hypothetical protein n=1 Tax=Candidatus Albibeggiatoa sp. nov. NOAA TaxID=3162724 RepID=UPI0032F9737A|nr:hypothetical protein [Thiotrichaceae bacterium]